MVDIVSSSAALNDHDIQSFRLSVIDSLKMQMTVVFSDGMKHEQIVSDKMTELEDLLRQEAIDIDLIKAVIDWVQHIRCKQKMPADFDISQVPSNPILKQLKAIILKSHDAPFLRDDYELLQKIYLYICHIQELKSSVQQRLESDLDMPRYYRTDIVSREWIQDNRNNLKKLMHAFEKAGFSDEEIAPPEWLDEVSRDEYYKERRKNLFTLLNGQENNEASLVVINRGLAHKELKTELETLFNEGERGARHYLTHYYYSREDEEDYFYKKNHKEKYGYGPGEREEMIELAIHLYLGFAELSDRQKELQKLYPDMIENFGKQLAHDSDKEYINTIILEYKIQHLAQRIIAGSIAFSAEDLQMQANYSQALEKKIQEIHKNVQRDKEREMYAKEKQKEFDRDNISENIYKQLKIIEYYFLNRLDIKTVDLHKITFSAPTQATLSVDGLLYFRDHQEKDMNQRFLDRMRGKEQEAPVFLKGLKVADLTYGALENAIKQLEEKDVAPLFGSLLRYHALPRLEDKSL